MNSVVPNPTPTRGPVATPRKTKKAPDPPTDQELSDLNKDENETMESSGASQQVQNDNKPTIPPRSPKPEFKPPPLEMSDRNKEAAFMTARDSVTTEDETTKKSSGKTRKLPPTPDASSYLYDQNKTGGDSHQGEPSSQPSAAAIGGGSQQDTFYQATATGMMVDVSKRSTEEKVMSDANGDPTGQINTMEKAVGDMEKSFVKAWNKLNFEIRCHDQKSICFDATDMFRPPALLQFALTSEQQKDVSINQLKSRNILLSITNDCLIFTYNNEKTVPWNEDDIQEAFIQTLTGDIMKDLTSIEASKCTQEGLDILQNIQITKPSVLRSGKVLLYTQDTHFYIVGSGRNIDKFLKECKLDQSEPAPKNVTQKVPLADNDILLLTKLDLIADIEKAVPGITFNVEMKILQGQNEDAIKASDMVKRVIRSIARKEVVFQDPNCARMFLKDGVKNQTVCNFLKCEVIKNKNAGVKSCYIDIESGYMPRIYVYCISEEAAVAAAKIIPDFLCINKMARTLYERVKGSVCGWFDSGKMCVVYSSEKEVQVVSTCDITENFNKLLGEKTDTSKTFSVPELACRYFDQFGSALLEKVNTDYKVSIKVEQNSFTLCGIPENISKAKQFIKESYALECLHVETDMSLIEKRKLQIDAVTEKHESCWSAKPGGRARTAMLKNVKYHATWCEPQTDSKLTIVEGCAADIDFDVMLVLVTDSLFPIVSKSSLKEGVARFIDHATELLSKQNRERSQPGSVGLLPQQICAGAFKSTKVMYLVVQKSTETQGFRSLPLHDNLINTILELGQSYDLSSVGIPIETDDLEGSFKMAELCNQITAKWMKVWSRQKHVPELFLCGETSLESILQMVNEPFKNSRGFSMQNFLGGIGQAPDAPTFVHTEVKIGDLLNSKADVIVNTTAKNLDLKDGFISNLILKKAGNSVQDECNRNYPHGVEHAEVAVTGSGNLGRMANVKHILHSSLEKYSCQKHEKAIDCVKRFVRNCLYTAEKLDVVSIAFPSLGTGKLHYPRRDVAAAMFDAVEEYRREAINRRLRHIYFIVYGGDESVCKAFQNEEVRRNNKKSLSKLREPGEHEGFLKKVLPLGPAPLECKVCLNIQDIPPNFVIVNLSNIAPGRQTKWTLKSAKDPPLSWNDELVSYQEITGEAQFKKMVKEILDETDSDRITGLVFYPLTKSSFKYSIGQQIKLFTEKVEERLYITEQKQRSLSYLREIWFAVDESGFSSAEHILVSGRLMQSLNNLTGGTSWEKVAASEASHKASINVIGPTKKAIQAASSEIKEILRQEKSSSKNQEKQLSNTVVFKPYVNPELKKTPTNPEKDNISTVHKTLQTYASQGARPKETGIALKSNIVPKGPQKTGADRQDSIDRDSSILDTFEVTAYVNHGITTFLKKSGEDKLTEWTEKVAKVFQVHFETNADKLNVQGSFFQIKAFQDYLNNDFPNLPDDPADAEDDEKRATDDTVVHKVVDNSENGIVFQYQIKNIKVYVYKGDLTKVNTDYIVSSASSYLTGNLGLEKAIFDAAGQQIRQECESYMKQRKNKALSPGEALITGPGNLKCNKIIHFAMPESLAWDGEKTMYSSFAGCINKAEREKAHSVAIPALGMGMLSSTSRLQEKFGGCFYRAVSEHSEEKNPSVTDVHFVDRNDKMVSSVMESLLTKFSCLKINQASIYVAHGNVTAAKADAVVVFQDSSFSFESKIAKAVASLSGDRYPIAIEAFKDQEPIIGSVYRTKTSGDMTNLCANIIHAVVIESKESPTKKRLPTLDDMKKTCKSIFMKCQKLDVTTLGVPVFEIDELNKDEYFNAMAEFVFEYFCTTEEPSVKEVHFLSEDTNAIKAFVDCLQKSC